VPDGALYARVDLVRRHDGRLALIEYEAIEPDLYLEYGAREELLLDALDAQVRRRG
jgi:glutathionylspermidine synthase